MKLPVLPWQRVLCLFGAGVSCSCVFCLQLVAGELSIRRKQVSEVEDYLPLTRQTLCQVSGGVEGAMCFFPSPCAVWLRTSGAVCRYWCSASVLGVCWRQTGASLDLPGLTSQQNAGAWSRWPPGLPPHPTCPMTPWSLVSGGSIPSSLLLQRWTNLRRCPGRVAFLSHCGDLGSFAFRWCQQSLHWLWLHGRAICAWVLHEVDEERMPALVGSSCKTGWRWFCRWGNSEMAACHVVGILLTRWHGVSRRGKCCFVTSLYHVPCAHKDYEFCEAGKWDSVVSIWSLWYLKLIPLSGLSLPISLCKLWLSRDN